MLKRTHRIDFFIIWAFYLTSSGFPQNISSIKTNRMHLRIPMLTWTMVRQNNSHGDTVACGAIHKIRFSNSNSTICSTWLWDSSLFKASSGFRVYLAITKKIKFTDFSLAISKIDSWTFEKNHEIIHSLNPHEIIHSLNP